MMTTSTTTTPSSRSTARTTTPTIATTRPRSPPSWKRRKSSSSHLRLTLVVWVAPALTRTSRRWAWSIIMHNNQASPSWWPFRKRSKMKFLISSMIHTMEATMIALIMLPSTICQTPIPRLKSSKTISNKWTKIESERQVNSHSSSKTRPIS